MLIYLIIILWFSICIIFAINFPLGRRSRPPLKYITETETEAGMSYLSEFL